MLTEIAVLAILIGQVQGRLSDRPTPAIFMHESMQAWCDGFAGASIAALHPASAFNNTELQELE